MAIYNPVISSVLTLKSTDIGAGDVCAEERIVEDYDILSSTLHPNIKAGFARYRDRIETKQAVADLLLFPTELQRAMDGLSETGEKLDVLFTIMVHCKTQLFSGNIDFMKNVLTSSLNHNSYDPFQIGKLQNKNVFEGGKRGPIKGYKVSDKSIECCYCGKVTYTNSEDFICLRIMDVQSRRVKNACCVNLQKHGYSTVSYVWTDVDEVCSRVGEVFYGIDGEPLNDMMQKLLNHVITPECKYVWIDQFCIDQDNLSDRELSVTHMDKTYSFCDMCIICLRKSTVESLLFLEWAYRINVNLNAHSNFDGNMDSRILAFLEYSVILSFVVDPWFSRGWTLQESILPRKLAVAIDGDGLTNLNWTLECSSVWIGRMATDTRYIVNLFSIPKSEYYISSMVMSLSSQLDGIFNGRSRPMDWNTIAKIMASRQTTVALDQVFCLRGILPRSQSIPVDYSAGVESLMRELSILYPESRSSLYFGDLACEHPTCWRQYMCLPPLLPIENPTAEQTYMGECMFVDISNDCVEGSIIRGCIETGHKNNLDINYVLGDATYGVLEIFYPEYIDDTIMKVEKDERGKVSGRASHMFLQIELYYRTWMSGTMMRTPENRALLAFTIRNPPYNTPTRLWMGDKRCFKTAKHVAPLFMDDRYFGWCFCP